MSTTHNDIETMVRDYVLGRLSDEEAEEFEAYFLGHADLVKMVSDFQTMQIAISGVEESRQAELVKVSSSSTSSTLLSRLKGVFTVPVPAYSVAALMAASFIGSQQVLNTIPSQNELQIARFTTAATRGKNLDQEVVINFSEYGGDVGLFLKVPEVNYQYYRVRLIAQNDGTDVWESTDFEFSALRDHLLVIPSKEISGVRIVKLVAGEENEFVSFCAYSEVCVDLN